MQITPNPPAVIIGPREQLFHLLAEAAEIEHTLMCSYLYAAFSLKSSDQPEFSAPEAAAVGRWRKVIMSVAIEEMSHLLTVANLSVAVGGRPHFGRPNFPVAPGYFPSGVVVRLTPFSLETLQHFIFLERPDGARHRDGEGFEPEENYQRAEAFHGLMPSVQDYATVGALYSALSQNLAASSARLGERTLFVGPAVAQVGPPAVDFKGVEAITNLEAALAAIEAIVEEGEGAAGDRQDSHYQRFLSIREEYRELVRANPSFAPAWPVAANPVMRRPPEAEGKVFVDHHEAAPVLDFGNALYSLLLRCLVQAFGREGDDADDAQARYLRVAIELMHMMADTARILVELPAQAGDTEFNAGMSFTMLRSVEPFLQGRSERLLMRERLLELADGVPVVAARFAKALGFRKKLEELASAFDAKFR